MLPENAVISDTSCFIILSKIDELSLLTKVFNHIVTTTEVANEFGKTLPEWVSIEAPTDKYTQQILENQIDKGESSAIALALEKPGCTIILDDLKARKIADKLGLKVTGTIGVIITAKKKGAIQSIKPFLQKIQKTDFRISKNLEQEALIEAGEFG